VGEAWLCAAWPLAHSWTRRARAFSFLTSPRPWCPQDNSEPQIKVLLVGKCPADYGSNQGDVKALIQNKFSNILVVDFYSRQVQCVIVCSKDDTNNAELRKFDDHCRRQGVDPMMHTYDLRNVIKPPAARGRGSAGGGHTPSSSSRGAGGHRDGPQGWTGPSPHSGVHQTPPSQARMHGSGARGGGFGGSPAAGVGLPPRGTLSIAPPMGVVSSAQLQRMACAMYVDDLPTCPSCHLPLLVWQLDGKGYYVRGRTHAGAPSSSDCCNSIATDAVLRWLAGNHDWSR
jgi:hypothetical protein